jgi:hypothetical protein
VRHRRRLSKVAQSTRERFRKLQRLVETVDTANQWLTELVVAHVTIELVSTWSNFVRSYYLSCALNARLGRRSRIRTSRPYASAQDALGAAVLRFNPKATPLATGLWHRRDEPDWKNNGTLITLASEASWSNLETIAAALSIRGARSTVDPPVARNFYAHRNAGTLAAARSLGPRYGIPQYERLSQILLAIPSGSPNSLLVEWTGELDTITEWLCE